MFVASSGSASTTKRRARVALLAAAGLVTLLVCPGQAAGSAPAVPASAAPHIAVGDHSTPKALANCTGSVTITFSPGLTGTTKTVTAKVTADSNKCVDSGGGATSIDGLGDTATVTGKCGKATITNATDTAQAQELSGAVPTAVTWSGTLNAAAGVANFHATGKIGSGDDAGSSFVADGSGTYAVGTCKTAAGLTGLKLTGTIVVK
ncbi:MAG: hypothetical protein JOZ47_08930 [Kutzneria sp.]|nr:hypothetical protein [Kutzneria sp.]